MSKSEVLVSEILHIAAVAELYFVGLLLSLLLVMVLSCELSRM